MIATVLAVACAKTSTPDSNVPDNRAPADQQDGAPCLGPSFRVEFATLTGRAPALVPEGCLASRTLSATGPCEFVSTNELVLFQLGPDRVPALQAKPPPLPAVGHAFDTQISVMLLADDPAETKTVEVDATVSIERVEPRAVCVQIIRRPGGVLPPSITQLGGLMKITLEDGDPRIAGER